MTLLQPAYRVTLGDHVMDTTDEPRASTITELLVELDMDTPADCARLLLGRVDGPDLAVTDPIVVELGYAGSGKFSRVFTGTITRLEPGLRHIHITALSPAAALLRTRVDQTYESRTAGDMVSDLARQAGVEVALTEPGIHFPACTIDGRRSIYDHLRDLADLCGFDLYFNTTGALIFRRFTGGDRTHRFRYGAEIVELELSHTPAAATRVEAWGESPGSGASESWAWLTKDFGGAKGTAGSGAPVLLLERPVLRSAEAAQAAAEARHAAITGRTLRGRMLAVGRPEIGLGDAIQLAELPDDRYNGRYAVRSITHRIDKRTGFTTVVGFRRMVREG